MDAHATTWNSCRCRQCRFAFLFRTSKLDNRSSDLCRRRSITDESGSPSRNTVGVKDQFRKQNRQHWFCNKHLSPDEETTRQLPQTTKANCAAGVKPPAI